MQEVEQDLTAIEQHRNASEYLSKSVDGHGEAGTPLSGGFGCGRTQPYLERLTQRALSYSDNVKLA